MSVVRLDRHADIGVIVIDHPPVNATSVAVRAGLVAALDALIADDRLVAGVLACDGPTFVAGADIREFGKPPVPPHLTEVIAAIEASPKPIVAAIHGTALGGGLELALGCHGRIATAEARLGLPEVTLGLIPGAGGTQRLPRLVGMLSALDLAATGKRITAADALAIGLIDAVAGPDLRGEAMARARALVGAGPRPLSAREVPPVDAAAFDAAAGRIVAKARGQRSPARAIEALRLAASLPFAEGMARERAIFVEERDGPQSKALRHAFFAEREAAKVPHLEGVSGRPVASVGVVGAGTMGAGIAAAFAEHGFPVTVVETNGEAAARGAARIAALFERQRASGRIDAAEEARRVARITTATELSALGATDLIVEAVFEDFDVKAELFGRLGSLARPGAIIATNTSYLDVDALARATGRPADVVGLHFFSPANVMRLVEIVEGKRTAPDVAAAALGVAKRLKKIPVLCGVGDGFVGNRILVAWRRVCECALEDGASPAEIDAALEAFGLAMGPFAVMDLAGLDIGHARRRRLDATRDPNERYASTVADRLVGLGRLGQKTGAGFYAYDGGRRANDPAVETVIAQVRAEKGIAPRGFDADLLRREVAAIMANEGARLLGEGLVARALDVDVVLVHGYGYPAWRGGPMFEADETGLTAVLATVEGVHARLGAGFEPAPLLVECARAGLRLSELPPRR